MDLTSATIEQPVAIETEESTSSVSLYFSCRNRPLTGEETDFELAQKTANGNIAAFELIYERYHGELTVCVCE